MKIAILSRGSGLYSTRSLFSAAAQRGHQVMILDHLQCSLLVERDGPAIFYQGDYLEKPDGLIPRIGTSVTGIGASVIRQFEDMGVFTLVRSRALLATRNKWGSLQILNQAGIPVPRSILPAPGQPIDPLVRALNGPPVVLKLLEGTHGSGVMLLDSLSAIRQVSEYLEKLDKRFFLQEYIREAAGADYRTLVVGNHIIATMERQAAQGEFRSNLHRGATARPVGLNGEEELLVKRAVRAMNLDVAGVDLLRSQNGPLLMEVNASPGLEGIENVTGADVAGEIILLLERKLKKWRAGSR